MSIEAQLPSHCGEIAELFIRDAATLLLGLRFCCAMRDHVPSVHSCYDHATTNTLPRRLCYLDIANMGASATLPLRSWRSGQLIAWFKCSPKVGVAILDSRTTSERFHAHVIEE